MKHPRKSRPGPKRRPAPRADEARKRNSGSEAQRAMDEWGVAPVAPARPARQEKSLSRKTGPHKKSASPPPVKPRKAAAAKKPARPSPGMSRETAPAQPVSRARVSGEPQRIAKLLARAGIASRREIERMIAERRIALNGVPIETPATLLPSLHGVTVDGAPVTDAETTRLFLFHKPAGCLTAERDFSGRKTIYDVLPKDLPRLMPVGRLDMTTEGLLLLTNDGELKRTLELPVNGIERTYRARAFGEVSQAQLESLIEGIEIEGMRYGRIDANMERRTGRNQWIELTLTEGKNREVRRVLEHLGLKVNRLIRTRYGPFDLADSAPGALVEIKRGDLDRFLGALKQMRK